jgi:ComF family protein
VAPPTVNQTTIRAVYNWLDFALSALIRTQCRLCNQRSEGPLGLCAPCAGDLAWLDYPCPLCGLPITDHIGACGSCLRRPPPYDALIAPLSYTGEAAAFIRRFKFHGDLAAGRLLGDLLHLKLRENIGRTEQPDAVIPMPLHPRRLRERGFNQASELARRLPWPTHRGVVRRRRATREQSHLNARERRRNVRGAFELTGTPIPERVAIVDDVVTTGTTVAELARTLRRGGAKRVVVIAVARAV